MSEKTDGVTEESKTKVLVLNTGCLRHGSMRKIELLINWFKVFDSYLFRGTQQHFFFHMTRNALNI